MKIFLALAVAVTVVTSVYSCASAPSPCTITLPNPQDNTGVQFDPAPTCNGNECSFSDGTTSNVDVDLGAICSNYRSGEFSVRGDEVSAWMTDDAFQTRIVGSCIGFERDAWWGQGEYQRGVDFAPRSLSVSCNAGTLTGNFEAERQIFRRPDANPTLINGRLTGFNTIQCSPCRSDNDIQRTVSYTEAAFALSGANAGACTAGVCTLPGQSITTGAGDTVVFTYQDGTCASNLVRLVGRTLDGSSGSSAAAYPTGFAQLINYQGTCVTLDYNANSGANGEDANADGLTLVNVGTVGLLNLHGMTEACVTGDLTTDGDGVAVAADRPAFCFGNVETIECGTCPSGTNPF